MAIILPKKQFKVFDEIIELSSDQLAQYKSIGLDIDSDILTIALVSNEVFELSSISQQDRASVCIEALNDYVNAVYKTAELVRRDGFI